MGFRCLAHVHTHHSLDSVLSPARIVAAARELGADVVIVTDHETQAGSLAVRQLANGNPRFVPTAAEYKTDKGDLIGVFLQSEIREKSAELVADQIHAQGGLVILPHPFKAHVLDDSLLSRVDIIEVYNSRCSPAENDSASELAATHGLPLLAGADAHCAGELYAALNLFEGETPSDQEQLRRALLQCPRSLNTRSVSAVYRPISQIVKAWKTRNAELLLWQSKQFAVTVARETWQKLTSPEL
jgi:predicted metal-dependent phosphoesterase TrpH